MHEVITRRFKRYLAEKEKTGEWADGETGLTEEDGRPKRFAYPPQLVVVDGGQPQVAAAKRALDELGIDDIAVCGLAKRLEEVWVPGDDDPVVLPRTSEGLYLLQRVRDEAHRFAITYQRTKRARRFKASPLDDVPGLGETRKQALIKHFGSVKKLRSATIDQICEVPGIGRKTAEAIAVALAQAAPAAPAVNTATGEIIEDEEFATEDTRQTRNPKRRRVPRGSPCPRAPRTNDGGRRDDRARAGRTLGRAHGGEPKHAHAAGPGEPHTAETEASHSEAREDRTQREAAGGTAGQEAADEAAQKDGAEVNTGTTIETAGVPEAAIPELVIISGMSGAGRSTAAKCLEDLGWFVVDNLPPALIPTMVELGARSQGNVARIAVVVDVRGRRFFDNLRESLADLETKHVTRRIVFLESSDDALVRRFEGVRRPHPLQGDGRIVDGIAAERELLRELRGDADLVIDTSSLNVHELRAKMDAQFAGEEEPELRATVMSFGFKYGLPVDADLVVDMRFLPNPHWVPELRQYTGLNEEVAAYVFNQPGAKEFLDRYAELLRLIQTGYRREGKRYVTIAVGCTGGKHRSVAMSEKLAARLVSEGVETVVVHRDMGRE